jgi:error-prone DNA polymerase
VRAQIEHEMKLIAELGFAGYFLTVWDIVRFARSRGILCQGRGSAANSVVCYLLGITSIDPVRMSLLFERFISAERGEPPDIDVDFEHERREEVIQYVFEKYGREHAAMVAAVICYRGKSAFREVGKVFGLSEDQLERLSSLQSDFQMGPWGRREQSERFLGQHPRAPAEQSEAPVSPGEPEVLPSYEEDLRNRPWHSTTPATAEALTSAGLDPEDETVRQVIQRALELRGLPRHLGQHSGGVLISKEPLPEMIAIENATMPLRTVLAWDKEDLEALGMYKIDLLALGMLSAIRRCFTAIKNVEGLELSLASIPAEDQAVYAMISDADTVGTFQVESRAQMQVLPKLRPRTFYDLVVSVAIIRPGPIQGDMVHPYLRRRAGEEAVEYPHPALEQILGKTYGVPLFQEQVMKIAVKVAGFTGGEADQLRRAIGWNSKLHIDRMGKRFVQGLLDNGLSSEYAERIFRMVQGFGNYGFPESHAASFALLAYASCYLKRYHPAAFLAAMLNSQPLGFYAPNTLLQDGLRHGVVVLPVSVLHSRWDSTLEAGDAEAQQRWWDHPQRAACARHTPWADWLEQGHSRGRKVQPVVRLGLKQVRGMSEVVGRRIEAVMFGEQPAKTIAELVARAEIPRLISKNLAVAGAFDGFTGDEESRARRHALWKVEALPEASTLLAGLELEDQGSAAALSPMLPEELLQADFHSTGLSSRTHPMALLREEMRAQGIADFQALCGWPSGKRIKVGGLITTRQRPGTASGVVFITLEDEYGHMNLVVFPKIFERYRALAKDAQFVVAVGKVERKQEVTNVIVQRLEPLRRIRSEPGAPAKPKGRYDRFGW